jgi:hypothetical protein
MKWKLDTKNVKNGIFVMLNYEGAQARSVSVNDEEVPYTKWTTYTDEDGKEVAGYAPLTGSKCGENRFIGVNSILEFYMTGECELEITPRDAIMAKVRMEWTMNEFFDSGGTTAFIDRLCASLGIHASTVKVVGVNEGSVLVDYEITPQADEEQTIEQIRAKQTQQIATGTLDLGAPILEASDGGAKLVEDGVVVAAGFAKVVLVKTSTN